MTFPAGPEAIDAAWLEDVLRRECGLPDASVRRVAAEIIGAGFGLDGTSARLTIEGDGVPATLVAKWTSAENARRESQFYREIAPRLDLRLPAMFCAQIDDAAKRGFLVLSDVAPARQGDTLLGATATESESLTDSMAVLHATYWAPAEAPVLGPLPKWVADEAQGRGVAEVLPRFLDEWAERLPSAALAVAAKLPESVNGARDALFRAPATLVHSDLHLDNVLFLEDGLPVIIDWPGVCRAPAALDFARLLVEGMTTSARREQEETLTNRYLAALASRGVDYDADRLRADSACVATLLYAAAVRWAAGPNATRPGVPRVALLSTELVKKCADATLAWSA